MPTEITMPRLSDTMSEGTVAKWRKRVGEKVEKGDILAEIETDKAIMDMEAFESGILGRIIINEGGTVPIGEPIALLVQAGEALPAAPAASPTPRQASAAPAPAAAPPTAVAQASAPVVAATPAAPAMEGRLRVSPLARRAAQERGVDLSQVTGTGPDGRIVKADVEAYAQRGPQVPPARVAFPGLTEEEEFVPLSLMQKTIVTRMLESKLNAPHFYVTSEVDMTEAIAFRKAINEAQPDGQGVSFNDIVVKAVAVALRSHPAVNSSYRDGQFVRYKAIHVGIAVAIPDGLVVPVVRNADQKGLAQIALEAKDLIDRARTRKLSLQEMEGSTFSVTNMGMFDVDQFAGIINVPNAAILAVGAITRKPVVKNEQIVIGDRMRLTVSCDHRVVYGADAALFLRELKRVLEHPALLAL